MNIAKQIKEDIYSNKKIREGNFFIDEPIVLDEPITVEMTGNGFLFNDPYQKGGLNHNNYVTAIIPTADFNVFEIKSRDVYINGGLIYTGLVPHTKAGIFYDVNERIIRSRINGTNVEGSWIDLVDGYGTKAIDFAKNILPDTRSEYGHYIDIININFAYCSIGINLEKPNQKISINSITVLNPKMWGCKKFFNFEIASNITIYNANLHSFPLFKNEDREYAITFFGSKSDVDYMIYDMTTNKRDTIGLSRHDFHELETDDETRKTVTFNNRFKRRY